jgi:hypothetical protein
MKALLLLAAAVSGPGMTHTAVPANSFSAIIKSHQRQGMSNATGVATFTIENQAMRYQVSLASMKQVTDVILLVEQKAIRLYGGEPSKNDVLEASGILTGANLQGFALEELVRVMETGRAQVIVFTTKYPDGSIAGKVIPTDEKPGAHEIPDPRVTAQTS